MLVLTADAEMYLCHTTALIIDELWEEYAEIVDEVGTSSNPTRSDEIVSLVVEFFDVWDDRFCSECCTPLTPVVAPWGEATMWCSECREI